MRFSNLTGGKSAHPTWPHAGSVDVIRSDENGRRWRFGRSLTRELGNMPITESTFIPHGSGFLVSTRGYDDRQRLHLTDEAFQVLRQADLTAAQTFIHGYAGHPRLFEQDGQIYLLGRNWTVRPRAMQLCLFRLDPATLTVSEGSILDNAERANVNDGYYAMPYFRGAGAEAKLHIVTYKAVKVQPAPDIVHFEYLWDEVK